MKDQSHSPYLRELRDKGSALGVSLTDADLTNLEKFCACLHEYNQHTNLVACSEPERMLIEHVLDSLALVPLLRLDPDSSALSLIDIGSGGGFPGMILALVKPDMNVVLVDSVAKKTRFLLDIVRIFKLEDRVQVLTGRAEDLAHRKQYRFQFTFATARAVGAIGLVSELTLPFLKCGGMAILQRSTRQLEEEEALLSLLPKTIGTQLVKVVRFNSEILGKGRGAFILTQKKLAAKNFPRPAAQIKYQPLI